jgi:hypothetical protein
MPITRAYGQASQLGNTPAASNPVINGAFDIWQRGTSIAIASNGSASYTADRWFNARNSTGQTVSRQATGDTTNLPNIQYCARVQRDSGSTNTTAIRLCTPFETVNSIPLAGKTVTLSFYARSGANFSATSSTMAAELITGTGTDQNVLTGGYTGIAYPIGSAFTLTTTWQRFTATATIATNVTEISLLFYFTPTGTAGAADYFEITGVQIDMGSVALPFRRAMNTLAGELAACQRYYYRHTAGAVFSTFGQGNARSTTNTAANIIFPVPMRTAPTSLDAGTASNYRVYDGQNATTCTTLAIEGQSDAYTGIVYTTVASGLTATRSYTLDANNTTAAYIGFSAEL